MSFRGVRRFQGEPGEKADRQRDGPDRFQPGFFHESSDVLNVRLGAAQANRCLLGDFCASCIGIGTGKIRHHQIIVGEIERLELRNLPLDCLL